MRNTVILGIVVALIIGFAGGFAVGRAKYKPLLEKQSQDIITRDNMIKTMKEETSRNMMKQKQEVSYGVQNGKLVSNANGAMVPVSEDIIFPNKTKIGKDGTVTRLDGTKFKLGSGEWLVVNSSSESAK